MKIYANSRRKSRERTYECVICGFQIEIENDEELELCPLCEGARFEKI